MNASIRGDSKEGRKVSSVVCVSLSVLVLVLSLIYGEPKDWFIPIIALCLSLMLFTRFSWVYSPGIGMLFGALVLWSGINHANWLSAGVGAFVLLMGFLGGLGKLLNPQQR